MIETVQFKDKSYPAFQTNGNASRFIMPFALEVCKGFGVDIGCNRAEWAFPNALLVDTALEGCEYDAHNLPDLQFDFAFSSHLLEHVSDWTGALNHWGTRLKKDATLFLYLPHYSQEYWRCWNNRKHINILTPEMIHDYLEAKGCTNIFVSGVDLYNSFAVMAQKG